MYRHDDCMCNSHDGHMSKSKDNYMCKTHDDCMDKSMDHYMNKSKDDYMDKSMEYARAYILPQKYENLFSCKEGFLMGTIFKDLYRPYHDHKHKRDDDHDNDCKQDECEG